MRSSTAALSPGLAAAKRRPEQPFLGLLVGATGAPRRRKRKTSCLRQVIKVREPVVGVQHAIPKIVEQCAMKAVRSRTRHEWWGEKTLADLEGEDWCEIEDFKEKLRELLGEEEEG